MKATRSTQPTFREVAKQTRDRDARRVRIFNADGVLLSICDEVSAHRYAIAPNAEVIRTHGGRVVAVKLLSVGDDTGHLGDRHGNSNITTYQETIPTMTCLSRITQHKNARL